VWQEGKLSWVLALLDVRHTEEPASYFMPLALAWEERDEERVRNLSTSAIAKVPPAGKRRVMGDAFADEAFCGRSWWRYRSAGKSHPRTASCSSVRPPPLHSWRVPTSRRCRPHGRKVPAPTPWWSMGERLILKGYRRLRDGASPELEMGLHLTEVVRFCELRTARRRPRIHGQRRPDETTRMLQAYVANQRRRMDLRAGVPAALSRSPSHRSRHRRAAVNAHEAFLVMIRTLAKRTAELHGALATRTGNADFDPEPLSRADFDGYRSARDRSAHRARIVEIQHRADSGRGTRKG